MEAATEAASAAAEPEAATETEAEAAMILSPNAHPALATGRRTAKTSRTKQCKRTPQPSSAAGESEGIVPEPRRYNPDLFARRCGEPRKATVAKERRLGSPERLPSKLSAFRPLTGPRAARSSPRPLEGLVWDPD